MADTYACEVSSVLRHMLGDTTNFATAKLTSLSFTCRIQGEYKKCQCSTEYLEEFFGWYEFELASLEGYVLEFLALPNFQRVSLELLPSFTAGNAFSLAKERLPGMFPRVDAVGKLHIKPVVCTSCTRALTISDLLH